MKKKTSPSPKRVKAPSRIAKPVVMRKNATGLPDKLKAGVELLAGYSLDGVKVHYNSAQPAYLQALAYAQGTDIQLAPGQESHLPHEAWHVSQHQQGRVTPTEQLAGNVSINDAALEEEANRLAEIGQNFGCKPTGNSSDLIRRKGEA